MTDRQKQNLDRSRRMAAGKQPRSIRCPYCNMRLLDVYGYDHNLVYVKCSKCKAVLTMDTALFRRRTQPQRCSAVPRRGGGDAGNAGMGYSPYENSPYPQGPDSGPNPFLPGPGRYVR